MARAVFKRGTPHTAQAAVGITLPTAAVQSGLLPVYHFISPFTTLALRLSDDSSASFG
jgi:hypothetical protein